jgi:DNA-binding MarR family transcriptional regulator
MAGSTGGPARLRENLIRRGAAARHEVPGGRVVPGSVTAHGERADRVWRRMYALVHEHDLLRAQASTALGMSETRVEAVRLVAAAPEPLTMGQLAALLHTDRPYASVVVDDLERHGLVARRPHPTDRRIRMVSATEEGHLVAARAEAALGGYRERLRALPPAELAALDSALEHLERPPARPRSA